MILMVLLYYCIAVISATLFGALIGLKLSFDMDSFESSLLFPTPIVALGLTAIFGYLFSLDIISSVAIGIFASIFSKCANKIFPGVLDGNN